MQPGVRANVLLDGCRKLKKKSNQCVHRTGTAI